MAESKKALVVGAGLVGALWTIFLARKGYQVEAYERRPDIREAGAIGGRSINLALSERGWKAIEKAGIADKIREVAIPMKGRMIHHANGDVIFQPYGKEGQAIYSVSRGGLNMELLNIADSFENVNLHFNQRCVDADLKNNVIYFEDAGDTHTPVYSPLIFGADGAFSAIRGAMQKGDRFNYSQQYLDFGYKELNIPPDEKGDFRMEPNALHIWPRKNFMLIALPNVDRSFTCTLFLPFEGDDAFEHLRSDDEVMAFFKHYFTDAVALMPTLLEDFRQNPTSSLMTVRCHPWHYAHRVLLIGDAAHGIVPFFGQGMNAGFEDCTILDAMMDEYGHDWSAIIDDFDATRFKDTNAIAELALRNFVEMRDLVADPMFLLRNKIAAHLQRKYPDTFLPAYSMVTFTHIPYSTALAEVERQNALFDRILALDGIAENWHSNPAVDEIYQKWSDER